jgi:lysophospholipid acyltransferase (LPLAT)-like uncharacterized protein
VPSNPKEGTLMKTPSIAAFASNSAPKLLKYLLLAMTKFNLWCGVGLEHLDPYVGENPVVITLWHEYLAVAPMCLPLIARRKGRNSMSMCALVSLHKDGQIAGRVATELGVTPVAGSTTQGGSRALRTLSQLTKKLKISVVITPDGPRGPRRTSEHGLPISLLNERPILPAAVVSHRAVRVSSWDNMMLPSLSNTGVGLYATAMMFSPFCNEETSAMVALRLNGTANRAEWVC